MVHLLKLQRKTEMKIKSNSIKSIALLAGLFVATSCDKDFQEVNTNPNDPESVPTALLLPTIIRNPVNEVAGLAWGYGNVVMQYSAKIQFTSEDRYLWGPEGDPYNSFYNAMRDVNNIIILSEEAGQPQYIGIAKIMRSWMYSFMTDAYGDIPYSEATSAKEGTNLPVFDTQESVYQGVLAELAEANTILASATGSVSGDILFGGDLMKWRKFANSLRLRIYMRLSDRTDPSSGMQAILSNLDANPILEGNDDNVALEYLSDAPNQQPQYTNRSGSFDEYRLSVNMETILKDLNDPRLFVYAQPTNDSGAGVVGSHADYAGVPNGLADAQALAYSPSGDPEKVGSNFISRIGLMFACRACNPDRASPTAAEAMLMSYAELQFILAEARERGFISTSTAETYYLNGINASFDYYLERLAVGSYPEIIEVASPDEAYFAQADVAYTGTTAEKLQKIGTQKWVALFFNGMEAWFDWRRTGIPAITPGPGAVIPTVPVRFMYPGDAQALNADNYKAAVARQGADAITTRVWWDVN
tara:strand:+ start:75034 stop:76626 length:1593 start_codon:yes stop_codon:yes gene_type:complete